MYHGIGGSGRGSRGGRGRGGGNIRPGAAPASASTVAQLRAQHRQASVLQRTPASTTTGSMAIASTGPMSPLPPNCAALKKVTLSVNPFLLDHTDD
jgi:hypothetical protein